MEKHSLQKTNCIGVTTDGCSTMVSEVKGAVSRILQECPNAVQCYCHNHALNLSVYKKPTALVCLQMAAVRGV